MGPGSPLPMGWPSILMTGKTKVDALVTNLDVAPTLLDLQAAEESAIMAAARRLAQALVATFSPDGVLLYQNNGVGSGQEVPHFHLHVVPRQPGSDWGFGPPHLERLEREGRLRHHDHLLETDDKKRTVGEIRRHLT